MLPPEIQIDPRKLPTPGKLYRVTKENGLNLWHDFEPMDPADSPLTLCQMAFGEIVMVVSLEHSPLWEGGEEEWTTLYLNLLKGEQMYKNVECSINEWRHHFEEVK